MNTDAEHQFQPGTLRQAIAERTRHALACGALQPIQTDQTFLEDQHERFIVRIVSSLRRKDQARQGQGLQRPHDSGAIGTSRPTGLNSVTNLSSAIGSRHAGRPTELKHGTDATSPANPFLPYDPDLFVAHISDTHVGLLNKFQVLEDHLLIVTRQFEHQEMLLTEADFQALWICLAEFDGLGFYNGGTEAGASQPHKHLQLLPLPLSTEGPALPLESRFHSLPPGGVIGTLTGLSFRHAVVRLDRSEASQATAAGLEAHRLYRDLLGAIGLPAREGINLRQSGPYNLLVTRDWMMLVPRSQECFEGVSINALGFAGSLFVRNEDERQILQKHGPWQVLAQVGLPSKGVSP